MIKVKFKVPKIKTKSLKEEVNKALIRAQKNAIEYEFNNSVDPYGKKWEPKKVPNGKPTLYASGRMRRSFKYSADGVINTTKYLKYHQTGTSKMPRRAIYPYKGLKGSIWRSRFNNSIKYILRNLVK